MDGDSDPSSDLGDELPVFDFLSQTSSRHKSAGAFPLVDDGAGVTVVSSGSEDEEPYVPLARRLKQRQASGPAAKDPEPLRGPSVGRRAPSHQGAAAALSSPEKSAVLGEIQASEGEALRRKESRERPHRDKELLRRERERERSERKALAEAAKTLRPEECIKHMVVVVDPGQFYVIFAPPSLILTCDFPSHVCVFSPPFSSPSCVALLQQEGGEALLLSVRDLGCSCAIEKQPVPRSVAWARRSPRAQVSPLRVAGETSEPLS